MNRRGLVVLALAVATLMAVCVHARASDLPPGIDCPTIRALVAHHGRASPAAMGLAAGLRLAGDKFCASMFGTSVRYRT